METTVFRSTCLDEIGARFSPVNIEQFIAAVNSDVIFI